MTVRVDYRDGSVLCEPEDVPDLVRRHGSVTVTRPGLYGHAEVPGCNPRDIKIRYKGDGTAHLVTPHVEMQLTGGCVHRDVLAFLSTELSVVEGEILLWEHAREEALEEATDVA